MNFLMMPIKTFLVADQDCQDAEDIGTNDFHEAEEYLISRREHQPDKHWTLLAEIDA